MAASRGSGDRGHDPAPNPLACVCRLFLAFARMSGLAFARMSGLAFARIASARMSGRRGEREIFIRRSAERRKSLSVRAPALNLGPRFREDERKGRMTGLAFARMSGGGGNVRSAAPDDLGPPGAGRDPDLETRGKRGSNLTVRLISPPASILSLMQLRAYCMGDRSAICSSASNG